MYNQGQVLKFACRTEVNLVGLIDDHDAASVRFFVPKTQEATYYIVSNPTKPRTMIESTKSGKESMCTLVIFI